MKGFEPEFVDIPDYIVKITERIWEGRAIGAIRRYYAEDCVMHTSMGPARGVSSVIAGTLDTLNAFPDRRLLPEQIIWSGDDETGYLSSHRVLAPATHLGDSIFGTPTGIELSFRAIADCRCVANRIVEEWLVRDQAGIAAQLGLDADMLAREYAHREAASVDGSWHIEAARRLKKEGAFRPAQLQDHRAAEFARETIAAIWGQAELDRVRKQYHPAATVRVPGAESLHGHERYCRWLFGLLAAIPDARIVIEHSSANGGERCAQASTRWWLTGTHCGHGRFGPPSGATVLMLGITHSEIVDGLIRNEWIVADEIALRKQIALKRG